MAGGRPAIWRGALPCSRACDCALGTRRDVWQLLRGGPRHVHAAHASDRSKAHGDPEQLRHNAVLKELLLCVQPLSKMPAEEQAEKQAEKQAEGELQGARVTCQQERLVDTERGAHQGTEVRTHARHSDQRQYFFSSAQLRRAV